MRFLNYYPDGRRARKAVSVFTNSTWQACQTNEFIYDRWNLIAEKVGRTVPGEPVATVSRHYTWGLDLSGLDGGQWSQDAGGIGGLLAITEVTGTSTNVFLPICDQVGTVMALMAAVTNNVTLSTPIVAARYEYSPYGELLELVTDYRSPITGGNPCPFGFQSKYRDEETGFSYFGYRFFDSRAAQWLNHDPLREGGGFNLVAFCGGDPVGTVDPLGLKVTIIEVGDIGPRISHVSKLAEYKLHLEAVKQTLRSMPDDQFAGADVFWNDLKFTGTRQDYIDLLDYELGSRVIRKTWDQRNALNLADISETMYDAFPENEPEITRGNITVKPYYFLVAHGDAETRSSIMGTHFRIPFDRMRANLQTAADRTGHPVTYCSCYSNEDRLPEKVTIGGGIGASAQEREIETNTIPPTMKRNWLIRVDQLAGGQALQGWKEDWEVSTWITVPKTLENPRGQTQHSNVTSSKTIRPGQGTP